jgi:hypothetical protein
MLRRAVRAVRRGQRAHLLVTERSMAPVLKPLQLVRVEPVDAERLQIGDVVIAEVGGRLHLHLVRHIDREARRVEIASRDGHLDGWTDYARVYGICTAIGGRPVPGAAAKTR